MEDSLTNLEPSRIEDRQSFLLACLTARYNNQQVEGIPAQWQQFARHIGKIPGQVGWTTYGFCFNMDGHGNMDYLCGVEVSAPSALPGGLAELRLAEQRYAIFFHRGHIPKIRNTWDAIFSQWLPTSGQKLTRAPQFETYGESFNPQIGNGGVEIWMPIER